MDNRTIFTKTAKGLGEAVGKTKALSRDFRKVIKEVDGQASYADLLEKLDGFSESKLAEILNKLKADDYIREFNSPVVIADNNSQFPPQPEFENSLNVLTMGAFLRELEKQPESAASADAGAEGVSSGTINEASKSEAEQGFLRASAGQAKKVSNDLIRQNAQAQAKKEAEEKARRDAEAKAKKEAEQRALQAAQAQAKKQAEEQAQREALAKAKKEAVEKAQREVLAKAKKETELRALQAAQARAKKEAEEQARLAAEAKAKEEAQERIRLAAAVAAKQEAERLLREQAEEQARKEAEEQARLVAAAKAKQEAERLARQLAEEQVRKETEELARLAAEARAKEEAQERARLAAEAAAKQEAERLARELAEEQARKETEEQARRAAEAKAKEEAKRLARQLAEEQVRKEAEEQARRAAEARAKEEAERLARQLAEEQARKETEELARLAAEARAKEEAQEQARLVAEAAAKQEAERLARQLAEEQARKEAEEQARLVAAAKAKQEAERLARQLAEEQARKETEELARLAVEARAKEEAQEQARLAAEAAAKQEAEWLAREQAEEQARLAAEAAAKEEAERLARELAQEQARKQAEEQARLEAEAMSRAKLEAEALALQEAEAQAKKEAEQELLKITEDNLKREAEEQAQLELEQQTHRAVQQELAELQAQEQQRALQEAQEKAERLQAQQQADLLKQEKLRQTQAEKQERAEERTRQRLELKRKREAEKEARRRERLAASTQRDTSYPSGVSWRQIVPGLVFVLIAGFFAWAQFSDFSERLQRIEKVAAEQFQQPVKIEALHFSFLPQPHWRLEKVRIGAQAQITIPQVKAVLDWASVLEGKTVLQSLDLQSPVLNQEGLGWLLFGKNQRLEIGIKHLTASNLTLDWPELTLGAFELRAAIDKGGAWQNMHLLSSNGGWQIELQPKDDLVQIQFNAKAFALPFGAKLNLANFSAEGVLDRTTLTLTRFYGVLNDGTLTGNTRLGWPGGLNGGWSLKGELRANQIKAALALPTLFESGMVEGRASFAMQARRADQLFASSRMNGNFSVRDGDVRGVHLVNLIQGVDHVGTSAFKNLNGAFNYEAGRTYFRNVSLSANLVSASGDAQLMANDEISARFVVELSTPVRQAHAVLLVSGNLKQPQFKRQTDGFSAPQAAPIPK